MTRALMCGLLLVSWGCQKSVAETPKESAPPPQVAAPAGEDWNDAQIGWKSFDEGMSAAAAERKPVCLVFFTTWCPHCKNYSKVFRDARVVEASRKFVMIRLDKDKNPQISAQYAPDGEYIPRTLFLSPSGVLDTAVHAPRAQFQFFYDEANPDSVLKGMEEEAKKSG